MFIKFVKANFNKEKIKNTQVLINEPIGYRLFDTITSKKNWEIRIKKLFSNNNKNIRYMGYTYIYTFCIF